MKKLLLAMTLSGLSAFGICAQTIFGYGLEKSEGTYQPLTDATVIYSGSALEELTECENLVWLPEGEQSSASGTTQGYPIDMPFSFNGQEVNRFIVYGSGVVQFGKDEIAYNSSVGTYFFTQGAAGSNLLACCSWRGMYVGTDTEVSYDVIGDEPSRTFVVEFKNMYVCHSYYDSNPARISIQYQAHENGNVALVFNDMSTIGDDSSISVRTGMRGNSSSEVVSLTGESLMESTLSHSATTINLTSDIPDGYTLTFTSPQEGAKPTTQPTDLVLTSITNQITGSFTADESDCRLAIVSDGALTEMPQDGQSYAVDDEIGNGRVILVGENTNFTLYSLTPSTEYTITVFACNSYCIGGPFYNTEEPLTATIKTKPATPVALSVLSYTTESITLSATANEGDRVIVVYNTEIERINTGDLPLIGELSGTYQVGDEIDGGGKVAYIGESSESFTVEGLDASTAYYFLAFGVSEDNEYSSAGLMAGSSTVIEPPYNTTFENAPRYQMPGGWTTYTDETGSVTFRVDTTSPYTTYTDSELHITGTINDTGGKPRYLTMPAIDVDKSGYMISFNSYMSMAESRFSTIPYDNWAEEDRLLIEGSTDNGTTWETITEYTATNHPAFSVTNDEGNTSSCFAELTADLSAFEGKTVQLRVNWLCFQPRTFGGEKLFIDSIAIDLIPAVPSLSVGDITPMSALLQWTSNCDNYEVAYGKAGEEKTTVIVENAFSYLLSELEPETNYEACVRGIDPDGEPTEWSNTVAFTTAAMPAVEPPTNLLTDTSSYDEDGKVTFSWDGTEEMLTYEMRYRERTSTEYTYVADLTETSCEVEGILPNTPYIWSVRAFCTYDRTTVWATQASLEIEQSGIASAETAKLAITTSNGNLTVTSGETAIETISIYDLAGRIISQTAVNACGSVTIPVGYTGTALVKVVCADSPRTFKVVF